MTVMLDDWRLYSSYAEMLLAYALEHRDDLLFRQLGQGYFQVGPGGTAAPTIKSKDKLPASDASD